VARSSVSAAGYGGEDLDPVSVSDGVVDAPALDLVAVEADGDELVDVSLPVEDLLRKARVATPDVFEALAHARARYIQLGSSPGRTAVRRGNHDLRHGNSSGEFGSVASASAIGLGIAALGS
jgi:hypothetical protein